MARSRWNTRSVGVGRPKRRLMNVQLSGMIGNFRCRKVVTLTCVCVRGCGSVCGCGSEYAIRNLVNGKIFCWTVFLVTHQGRNLGRPWVNLAGVKSSYDIFIFLNYSISTQSFFFKREFWFQSSLGLPFIFLSNWKRTSNSWIGAFELTSYSIAAAPIFFYVSAILTHFVHCGHINLHLAHQ